jgi:chromosome segregation ATPase
MYSEFSSFKTDITTEIKGIRQDLNGVKEDVKELKQDLNGVKEDVKELKQDLNGVKEDVKELKQDLNDVKEDVKGLNQDVKSLNVKVDKNTILLETLTNKVETIAEVQKSHMNQNEKDHNGIVKSLNEKVDAIELAVKDISKDVKEIQENLEPLCEDMIVVKSVVKIIVNDIADLSGEMEFIEMKEFNNERELFKIKKKLTQ